MTRPSYKEQITSKVNEQLPEAMRMFTIEECMRRWWQTGARSDGLRLTDTGDTMFRIAEIEYYQYDFSVKLEEGWHGYILDMSKKLKCPYYLGVLKQEGKKGKPYIRLYDSKIAMMVSLYGNIDDYLKSVRTGK